MRTVLCMVACLSAVSMGCPSTGDSVGTGEGEGEGECEGEGEVPLCAEQFGIDPVDVDTHCAGASIDVVILPAVAGLTLTSDALPDALDLVLAGGQWRLRGEAPSPPGFLEMALDVTAEQVENGCLLRSVFPVGLAIDPCNGEPTCAPTARSLDITGFCLPPTIDADASFQVLTVVDECVGSSCHEVRPAICDVVVDGPEITVGGTACIRSRVANSCSEDCGGGNGAPCIVPPLSAGTYQFSSTAGALTIAIPFNQPEEGLRCVGPGF